jgi:hypothetical protein
LSATSSPDEVRFSESGPKIASRSASFSSWTAAARASTAFYRDAKLFCPVGSVSVVEEQPRAIITISIATTPGKNLNILFLYTCISIDWVPLYMH